MFRCDVMGGMGGTMRITPFEWSGDNVQDGIWYSSVE